MAVQEQGSRRHSSGETASTYLRRLTSWAIATVVALASFQGTNIALAYWDEHSRVVRASEDVSQIVAAFKSIYGTKPLDLGNWDTDITGLAINDHFLPDDMLPRDVSCADTASSDSCYGVGPWSSTTVKILSGQQYNAIGIVYSNLSQTACSHLASALVVPGSGLVIVNINSIGYGFSPYGNSSYPTSSDVVAACTNIGNNNMMQLLYSIK
jgi:hypothetical protein